MTRTSPARLPPPSIMRHKHADLAITFRPGHKKAGVAKERFDVYKTAKTVGEYFALGGRNADWNWDLSKGIVKFDDEEWQDQVTITFGGAGSRGRTSKTTNFAAYPSDSSHLHHLTEVMSAAYAHAS